MRCIHGRPLGNPCPECMAGLDHAHMSKTIPGIEGEPPFSPPIHGNNDGVVTDATGAFIADTDGHENRAACIAYALNALYGRSNP